MSVQIGEIEKLISEYFEQNKYSQIAVVVDENTQKHCYPLINKHLPKHLLIKITSGEPEKNLKTCEKVWEKLTKATFDRHALVINLGGGVIGDMGGFCAATYKRGIEFIQVPTTLLAQVDASVGGKLGIDFHGYKNHLGVFQQPKAVLVDSQFLNTLSDRELRSGFAEIIKHCLIRDADKWQIIRRVDFEEQNLAELVGHSIAIKTEIVSADPTEEGLRKILNFGHTLGHAIETFFLDRGKHKLLHGEAIAVGMICEAFIAMKKRIIDETLYLEIEEFLFSIYGKAAIKESHIEGILKHTLQDKKNRDGKVRMALLNGRGSATFDVICSKKEMQIALLEYIG